MAVSRGAVYITGENDDRLTIFAFDAKGKEKWHVEHGGVWLQHARRPARPALTATTSTCSRETDCWAASIRPRARRWDCDAKQFGGSPGEWGYAESPLIWGGLVIFKPGGPNCIVALDKKTGRKVWSSHGFEAGPEYSFLPADLLR